VHSTGFDKIFMQGRLFRNLAKNPKFWIVLCLDTVLIVLAHYLAYAVRFELYLNDQTLRQCASLLPFILSIKIPSFYIFGLYRGMWRYTSLNDITNILIVTLFSSTVIISLLLLGNRFEGLSRSVFILDCFFTFVLITGHRVAIRYVYQRFNNSHSFLTPEARTEKKRLLLIGAGDAAEKVLREINENSQLPYRAIGLVDDDPAKIGLKLHGIPVIGLTDDLEEHVLRSRAQEILIATVVVNKAQMRRFVTLCQRTQLPYKVLPTWAN
jgi:FlaA1/EpsC-like NDP-sugar epimerase